MPKLKAQVGLAKSFSMREILVGLLGMLASAVIGFLVCYIMYVKTISYAYFALPVVFMVTIGYWAKKE